MLFDTSRLVPEARSIVEAAAAIYVRHTQPWFVGLIVQGHDPFFIWSLPKAQAIALFPSETPLGQTSRGFYQAVQTYYPSEETVREGLAVITTGVAFLHAAKTWWQAHS